MGERRRERERGRTAEEEDKGKQRESERGDLDFRQRSGPRLIYSVREPSLIGENSSYRFSSAHTVNHVHVLQTYSKQPKYNDYSCTCVFTNTDPLNLSYPYPILFVSFMVKKYILFVSFENWLCILIPDNCCSWCELFNVY